MSHQMDYSSLIPINSEEKLLANDPNLKVFEDSFCEKMKALKQKRALIVRANFFLLFILSLIFSLLVLFIIVIFTQLQMMVNVKKIYVHLIK